MNLWNMMNTKPKSDPFSCSLCKFILLFFNVSGTWI